MNKFEREPKSPLDGFQTHEVVRLIAIKKRVQRGEFSDLTFEAKRDQFAIWLQQNGRLGVNPSPTTTTPNALVEGLEKGLEEEWHQNHPHKTPPKEVEIKKETEELTPEAKRLEFARWLKTNGRVNDFNIVDTQKEEDKKKAEEQPIKPGFQPTRPEAFAKEIDKSLVEEEQKKWEEIREKLKREGRLVRLGRRTDVIPLQTLPKFSKPTAKNQPLPEKPRPETPPKKITEQKRLENAKSLYERGWIGSDDNFPTRTKIGEAVEKASQKMEEIEQEWLAQVREKIQAIETESIAQVPDQTSGTQIEAIEKTTEQKKLEFARWLKTNGRVNDFYIKDEANKEEKPENSQDQPFKFKGRDINEPLVPSDRSLPKIDEPRIDTEPKITSGKIEIDWEAPGRGNYGE